MNKSEEENQQILLSPMTSSSINEQLLTEATDWRRQHNPPERP